MNLPSDIPLSSLHLYLTAPYPCSYLPDREARSQVVGPSLLITPPLYSELVHHGFRRSGTFTYRPHCDACRACIPVRVIVDAFTPSRSQVRSIRRHAGLKASLHKLSDKPEYFKLYRRYQEVRHPEDARDNDFGQYRSFLLQSHVDTLLVEFREAGILRMVSVIDVLADGLSAVYTFYDPDVPRASYGVYNVLWQIELCRRLTLPYLYLGYWVRDSRKMAYKARYRPLEALLEGTWQLLEPDK